MSANKSCLPLPLLLRRSNALERASEHRHAILSTTSCGDIVDRIAWRCGLPNPKPNTYEWTPFSERGRASPLPASQPEAKTHGGVSRNQKGSKVDSGFVPDPSHIPITLDPSNPISCSTDQLPLCLLALHRAACQRNHSSKHAALVNYPTLSLSML
jgi:hypothetical protein